MKDVVMVVLAIFLGSLAGYGVWDAWLTETGLLGLVAGPMVGGLVGWIAADMIGFFRAVRAAFRRLKLPLLHGVDYGCAVGGFAGSLAFLGSLAWFVLVHFSDAGRGGSDATSPILIVLVSTAGGAAFGFVMGFLVAFGNTFTDPPHIGLWEWTESMLVKGNAIVWVIWPVYWIALRVSAAWWSVSRVREIADTFPKLTMVAIKKAGVELGAAARDVVRLTLSRRSVTAATFSAIFALASIVYGHPFWMALIGAVVGGAVYHVAHGLVEDRTQT